MGKPKREAASVSFHYLLRDKSKRGEQQFSSFSQEDFDALLKAIENQPAVDVHDPLVLNQIRFGSIIPFSDFVRKDKRSAFAKFKAPYSGHSFDNTEKGKISADSINQRSFNFLLYLSDTGRIYVGAQYLGNYGGWIPLYLAIKKLLGEPSKIVSTSFRNELIYLHGAAPKEIQVTIHRQPKKLAADPSLAGRAMFSLQREEKGDEFEQDTKANILPLLGQERSKILGN